MTAVIAPSPVRISDDPRVQYLLRIGDTCLVMAQRLCEWSGRAPTLEEDIALSNTGLDLLGQARAVLTRAGELQAAAGGERHDEDALAFRREERDYRNVTLVELPRGDFAMTVLRNLAMATFLERLWTALERSNDAELAGIAGKALKEARYHREHAALWVVRLGDGTEESARRLHEAMAVVALYVPELFADDAVDEAAEASGLGPRWSGLEADWRASMDAVLETAGLSWPKERAFRSTGKRGVHSEHLGYLLAEMQYLQRAYPGGRW